MGTAVRSNGALIREDSPATKVDVAGSDGDERVNCVVYGI
jgi:hypothetical protein